MITIVWPSDFSISPATSRVIRSVEPPAAQGTIRLIGRTGFQSEASAGKVKMPALMAAPATAIRMPQYPTRHPRLSCHFPGLYGQTGNSRNCYRATITIALLAPISSRTPRPVIGVDGAGWRLAADNGLDLADGFEQLAFKRGRGQI